MPALVLDVREDGTLTATLDGAPVEPVSGMWRRESVPKILDRATRSRTVPLRVEVHEVDGSVFTDIIAPIRRRPPAHAATETDKALTAVSELIEVTGAAGFVPGEDVAVALIISHSGAAPDGTARAVLTLEQVAACVIGETVLFGRISGTAVLVRVDS
ncbi:hypothetical protein [Humibacter ginsenosidimutans]|nr:hypothetical protein [Humibacter ginsenosidimutans]